MAMIAMTTSNSIKVKPSRRRGAAGRIIFSFFTGLPEKIWHPGTNSAIGHLFYLEQRARRKLPQVEQNPADLCARTHRLVHAEEFHDGFGSRLDMKLLINRMQMGPHRAEADAE